MPLVGHVTDIILNMTYLNFPDALRAVVDGVRHLGYFAGLPPIGALRLDEAWWDRSYRVGKNDRYAVDGRESHRLAVTAAVALHDRQRASVLDVGCGTGQFLRHVGRFQIGRYTGVDFSAAALDVARGAVLKDAGGYETAAPLRTAVSWVQGDLDTWRPPEPVDVLLMSEVMYYLARPADVLRDLLRVVRPGGVAVFSMWEDGRRWRQWRTVTRAVRERGASSTADVRVREGGFAWRIRRFDMPSSLDDHAGDVEHQHARQHAAERRQWALARQPIVPDQSTPNGVRNLEHRASSDGKEEH